jgi:hypothetical protein
MLFQRGTQRAGLDERRLTGIVDGKHLVHPPQVDGDHRWGIAGELHAADHAGAPAVGDDRCAHVRTPIQQRDDVGIAAGEATRSGGAAKSRANARAESGKDEP